MVLNIGLYFLFLITSVRISICLWLPNPLSGQFAFPEAHFHGVHFSEGKKKLVQPLIQILSTKRDPGVNVHQA